MANTFREYYQQAHGKPYQREDRSDCCALCDHHARLDPWYLCAECAPLVKNGHFRNVVKHWYYVGLRDRGVQENIYEQLPPLAKRALLQCVKDFPHWLFRDLHFDKYQEEFLLSDKAIRAILAGNRSGKTWDWVYLAAEWLTCAKPEDYPDGWPSRFRFEAPVSGRIVVSKMENVTRRLAPQYFARLFPYWPMGRSRDEAPHHTNKKWRIEYTSTNITKITYLPTGSYVDFIAVLQEKEKANIGEGDKFHWCACDEPPTRTLYVNSLRGLTDFRGAMIVAATPVLEHFWMKDLIEDQENVNPEIGVYRWSIWQNHQLNGGVLTTKAIHNVLSAATPEERIARETGQFTLMVGSYFAGPLRRNPKIIIDLEPPIDNQWIAVTALDYHTSTDARFLLAAITPLDQLIFLQELTFTPLLEEIANGVQDCLLEWGINRHGDFVADQSMSEELKMVRDRAYDAINPFRTMNVMLADRGLRTMGMITGAQGAIPRALGMFDKVKTVDGSEIYPMLINRLGCPELLRTLPKLRRSSVKSGDRAGSPKAQPDKRAAEGAHVIDCWLYIIGRQYRYEALNVQREYKPGTHGAFRAELLRVKNEDKAAQEFIGHSSRSNAYRIT